MAGSLDGLCIFERPTQTEKVRSGGQKREYADFFQARWRINVAIERALAADHSIHPFFHISRFKANGSKFLINRIAALRLDQVFHDVFIAHSPPGSQWPQTRLDDHAIKAQ